MCIIYLCACAHEFALIWLQFEGRITANDILEETYSSQTWKKSSFSFFLSLSSEYFLCDNSVGKTLKSGGRESLTGIYCTNNFDQLVTYMVLVCIYTHFYTMCLSHLDQSPNHPPAGSLSEVG